MKKNIIIILLTLSNVLMFFFGKVTFSNSPIKKLNGTYTFERMEKLDVFQETYLSLSEDTGEYFYISSSTQQIGSLIKKGENIYLLQNQKLDGAYIVITKDEDIIIITDNKVMNIYQFDSQLTLLPI